MSCDQGCNLSVRGGRKVPKGRTVLKSIPITQRLAREAAALEALQSIG